MNFVTSALVFYICVIDYVINIVLWNFITKPVKWL